MFADRRDAARELARWLARYKDAADAVVLAIPRGGVVIGAVLAEELGLPLDVVLTKKIGHPDNPEYAIGVVSLSGEIVDEAVVERESIPRAYLAGEIARLRAQLQKRRRLYRGGRPEIPLPGKTAIVCDDGIATGNTMLAAIRLARAAGAKKVVAAAPVGAPDSVAALSEAADEVVCVLQPEPFLAIGGFYRDFKQVEDEEAISLLKAAAARSAA